MKILTKREAKTNPEYGLSPESRSIEQLLTYGIVNINKPAGPSSHQVSDYVKKILKLKRTGHSGTLDPGVTGCLVIALEKATRIVQVLLKSPKEYVCLMHLHKPVDEKEIINSFKKFSGKIEQLPPLRSAVKRQLRTREVYSLEILEIKKQDVLFRVNCQAGTYVRKLCHDIGLDLKTNAHMTQLIRTKVANFNDKNWCSLQELKDTYSEYLDGNEKDLRKIVFPFEKVIENIPKVYVLDSTVDSLVSGANLNIPGISKLTEFNKNELVAVLTLKGELVSLGYSQLSSKEILEEEKGFAVKSWKVFMEKGIYPKIS